MTCSIEPSVPKSVYVQDCTSLVTSRRKKTYAAHASHRKKATFVVMSCWQSYTRSVTGSSFYKSKEPLMSVCNGQALLANDEKSEGSFGSAGRSQNHEEALNIPHTSWVVNIDSWAVEEIHSTLLYQSCSQATTGQC